MTKPDLDSAYALGGKEETREFYKAWAETYDQTFAQDRGYRSPAEVARRFRAAADGNLQRPLGNDRRRDQCFAPPGPNRYGAGVLRRLGTRGPAFASGYRR